MYPFPNCQRQKSPQPNLSVSKLHLVEGTECHRPYSLRLAETTTPWKFNSSPLKIYHPKRKVIFQPSFFRGYVKLREGKQLVASCKTANPTVTHWQVGPVCNFCLEFCFQRWVKWKKNTMRLCDRKTLSNTLGRLGKTLDLVRNCEEFPMIYHRTMWLVVTMTIHNRVV